jgi:hypothetical protein
MWVIFSHLLFSFLQFAAKNSVHYFKSNVFFPLFYLRVSEYPVILEHELQKLISGNHLILFNSRIMSLNCKKDCCCLGGGTV